MISSICIGSLGIPAHLQEFPPTSEAALQRAAAISPGHYARTRNALDGAVTGLSPYLTHGMVSLPQVARQVASQHRLSYDDKLVFEFGWREFFHHVWSRLASPEQILRDMRPMNLWQGRYAQDLPVDIRQGRTGVPCIDAAVRQLYATGYLHNHARMWLASYCVHLRKVHWRAGADWLYGHLLDGDLPSNHLSWQWVASSFSSKPYLFNASNVAKFAPQSAWMAWASPKTAIDISYEQLDTIARHQGDVGAEPGVHEGLPEPELVSTDPTTFLKHFEPLAPTKYTSTATEFIASQLQLQPLRSVELVHPWALSDQPIATHSVQKPLRIGVIHLAAHAQLPWSERRWRFVLTCMHSICDVIWLGDLAQLPNIPFWPSKAQVAATATLFAGYREVLPRLAHVQPAPNLFPNPLKPCNSFSKFYEAVQRDESDFLSLIGLGKHIKLL